MRKANSADPAEDRGPGHPIDAEHKGGAIEAWRYGDHPNRFSFSLRTLMILMTLFAVTMGLGAVAYRSMDRSGRPSVFDVAAD